jgi:flagellar hook assembly protein FlgD
MGWVLAHESSHLFGAQDEYEGKSCDLSSGYLRAFNANSYGASGDQHCHNHLDCMMAVDWTWDLCPDSRKQVGWWDSDLNGVYDPIDHPSATATMLIGDGSLARGDSVNIYTSAGRWVKRLDASATGSDQGYVIWDGIDYEGIPATPGDYTWKRNGGVANDADLNGDYASPSVSDLTVLPGAPPFLVDTLCFRFTDADTWAGRVRAVLAPGFGAQRRLIEDEVTLDTDHGVAPIMKTIPRGWAVGNSGISLLVWDGAGHQASRSISYMPSAGALDLATDLPDITLSIGRPNPSPWGMAWDLSMASRCRVSIDVIGIDGRRVRSWPTRQVASGRTAIVWDGCDDNGIPLPSGRYYLVIRDDSGRVLSGAGTVVR